jgi:glutamine synthetase
MAGLSLVYMLDDMPQNPFTGAYIIFPESESNIFSMNLLERYEQVGIDVESFITYSHQYSGIEFVPRLLDEALRNLSLSKWIAGSFASSQYRRIHFERIKENSNPIHISIWDKEMSKNLFFDPQKENDISDIYMHFIAGILAHFDEIHALIAALSEQQPTLVFRKEFTVNNVDSFLGLPDYFVESKKKDRVGWSKRMVVRGIDPNSNLYIILGAIYASGLEGIIKQYDYKHFTSPDRTNLDTSIPKKAKILQDSAFFANLFGEKILNSIVSKLNSLN